VSSEALAREDPRLSDISWNPNFLVIVLVLLLGLESLAVELKCENENDYEKEND